MTAQGSYRTHRRANYIMNNNLQKNITGQNMTLENQITKEFWSCKLSLTHSRALMKLAAHKKLQINFAVSQKYIHLPLLQVFNLIFNFSFVCQLLAVARGEMTGLLLSFHQMSNMLQISYSFPAFCDFMCKKTGFLWGLRPKEIICCSRGNHFVTVLWHFVDLCRQ